VAISSSAPADALVRTTATGDYAATVPPNEPINEAHCGYHWNYRQSMRFLNSSCNKNLCPLPDREPYAQFIYAPGRKTATWISGCPGEFRIYALDNCAC
jgi:hypothetical protein